MKAELPEFIYTKCQAHGLLHMQHSKELVMAFFTNIVHSKVDEVYERYHPSQPQQPSDNDQFDLSEGHGYSNGLGTTIHAVPIAHTGNRLISREGVNSLQLGNLLNSLSDHNMNHLSSPDVQSSSMPTTNPGSLFTTNYSRAPESSATQSVPFQPTTFSGTDHFPITDMQDSFHAYQPDATHGTFYGDGQIPMNTGQGMNP